MTTNQEPPSWSELYGRVPECRPTTLLGVARLVHEEYDLIDKDLDALCGFAAVEWLAKEHDIHIEYRRDDDTWFTPDYVQVRQPTLDAALRAAVSAVAGEGK